MMVRTRIAPSPTGDLHIGHLRTLLYNWAFARKNNGKFLVRIEDTDRVRYVEGSTERTLDVIKDFGFDWDEYAVQSERLEIYKRHAEELIEKGAAYRCFCTKERLDELRKSQEKAGQLTKYDKRCLGLSKKEIEENLKKNLPYVIRLNVPSGHNISFKDEVYGEVSFESDSVDDQVLLKSDGFPTYHLAVVVDDHLMEVTHVMRGNDWLPSTPKHVLLYEAFGWEMPTHIHLPNLKESGGSKKLSKRGGSVHASQFLEEGYLPEAILNFLMFLGWNPGGEKEMYTVEEFTKEFSIDRIHKTDLVAMDREKLLWFNGQYIRNMKVEDLHERILAWKSKYSVDLPAGFNGKDSGVKVLKLIQERLRKFDEVLESVGYFFDKPAVDSKLLTEFAGDKTKAVLSDFIGLFTDAKDWSSAELDKVSHDFIAQKGYKPKEAFMTVRVAVSGSKVTPPLFDILELLGKEETLDRLREALKNV